MQKKKGRPPKKEDAAKLPEKAASNQKEKDIFIAGLKKQGMVGNVHKKIDLISTGSWVVNRLIGDGTHKNLSGGIPRGWVAELYGDESTGKTTLALHIAKQTLLLGETVIYADFEQSLRTQFQYLENLGIDTNSSNFLHLVPTNFEEGVKVIGQGLVKLRPALIVIDSVTAMLPKETMENEAGDPAAIGKHARLVGSFLNWITKKLQPYNCSLLLVNQMRANIKASKYDPGPSSITTGGNAPKFFTTLRIRLKDTGKKEEVSNKSSITGLDEKKIVSKEVKVVIEKNKLDMPYKSGPIFIIFGQGIDNILSLISLGINKKVIKAGGAGYFQWKDPNGTASFNIQGKMALKKHLEENPDTLKALQPYLLPTKDDAEMDNIQSELEAKGVGNLNADEKEQLREIRKMKGLSTEDLSFTAEELAELEGLNEIVAEAKSDDSGEESVAQDA
jgi:recombination protein RecA